MNVLRFMQDNNITDHRLFAMNFDGLLAVSNVCSLLCINKINNLYIDSETINFDAEVEEPDMSIPMDKSSGYEKYSICTNIINNNLNINMKVSTV